MCHAYNEKREKRNNGKNKTWQSKKHQNTWRKTKQQIPGNIWNRYNQANRDERKSKKVAHQQKKWKNKLCNRNHIKGINAYAVCKILWTLLKMDKGETQIDGP